MRKIITKISLDTEYYLRIVSKYPHKRFYLLDEENKYVPFGVINAFDFIDKSGNSSFDFYIEHKNPTSISKLRINNTQSVHFERIFGKRRLLQNSSEVWEGIKFRVTIEDGKFFARFPLGKFELENITGE